ncbi:hypothetical protein [Pontibacillus yanchengensis]|uniref:Phospholipase n=1 Tax=Pontibacillus yanchengensis Y32 TaxID=1385514 RepID=A0A0A2TNY4_9BACI|nr:hypothetical protein [Pontibacillus yanchengensis]KGP71050.1 phospholipase [Pontibacillus yanchengensis Y32]
MKEVVRKSIVSLFVFVFMLGIAHPHITNASEITVDENSSMEEVQEVMQQYITTDSEGRVSFDVEKAVQDGQSDFVIESGEYINRLDQDYNPEGFTTMGLSLPVWGNWCGPGHGGGTPKDDLDRACMYHDKDYAKYGYFDCDSDFRLIARIGVYYDDMGFIEKRVATAVASYFTAQTKVNGCY